VTSRTKLTVVAALATMLAALSLSATFRTTAWFWPAVAGVTVASAGCALGRRLELPRPLVPFVGLIGLIVLITWLFADDAILGLIPGPGAIRSLNEIAVEAGRAMARYSSPAPTTTGLLLVTTAGVGFVALVVDTLAVTYRSAALAGVPLLALYAVPVTIVRPGVPWLLFVLGAVGWLASGCPAGAVRSDVARPGSASTQCRTHRGGRWGLRPCRASRSASWGVGSGQRPSAWP